MPTGVARTIASVGLAAGVLGTPAAALGANETPTPSPSSEISAAHATGTALADKVGEARVIATARAEDEASQRELNALNGTPTETLTPTPISTAEAKATQTAVAQETALSKRATAINATQAAIEQSRTPTPTVKPLPTAIESAGRPASQADGQNGIDLGGDIKKIMGGFLGGFVAGIGALGLGIRWVRGRRSVGEKAKPSEDADKVEDGEDDSK